MNGDEWREYLNKQMQMKSMMDREKKEMSREQIQNLK